jgi:hypothetical protein
MENNNELLQTNIFYFKKKLNINFVIFLTSSSLLYWVWHNLYTLKITIVQELGAKKLIIFCSLDYSINVTPNFNNKKTH